MGNPQDRKFSHTPVKGLDGVCFVAGWFGWFFFLAGGDGKVDFFYVVSKQCFPKKNSGS